MEKQGRSGGRRGSNASKFSYDAYYGRGTGKDDRRYDERGSQSRRSGYNFDEIVLSSRGEAEEVIMKMEELVSVYGIASVADLYELMDVSSNNYTDNNYGWTDVRMAEPLRTRDGYIVKMPRAMPIK